MNECCTVDNVTLSSSDGASSAKVNCLTCKTCGHHEAFVYHRENPDNARFSLVRLGILRRKRHGWSEFSDSQEVSNL